MQKLFTSGFITFFEPYWVIIMCTSVYLEAEFFVQYGSIFSFTFDYMIKLLLLSSELLVCFLIGFELY
jgi:hypothetical protein